MHQAHRIMVPALAIFVIASCGGESTFDPDTTIDMLDDGTDTGMDTTGDGVDDPVGDMPTECPDDDGDGVCNDDDVCPGGDDTVDSDGDTVPDFCDCEGLTCGDNAHCEEGVSGPECVCDDGYEGDGMTCTDIDECTLGTDTCDANATCTNTDGGFDCTCNAGFSGDGFTCTDDDECTLGTDTCDANATCINTDGGYDCTCNVGYDGDGFTCADIDECTLGTDTCDTNATCTNTDGGYTCACNTGWDGDGFTCSDIDECTLGTDTCDTNATCTNTPGSYTCACITGYSGDGFTCTAIDHCALGTDTCDTNATCTFTGPGTYTCACNSGYTGDGFTCTPLGLPDEILFVSDVSSDTNIPTVLTGDGHTVTTVTGDFATGNATLSGALGGYEAVFWSATGSGVGSTHSTTVITNLESYVSAGGRVFVTGYDSVASPTDTNLINFLGGTGSRDVPSAPGAVIPDGNSLTMPVVDIRGVTPSGYYSDRDALTGLTTNTVNVVPSSSVAGEAQWSIRKLGAGEIAYVSNGQSGTSAHASWANTSTGGAGAYNAAIRNFAVGYRQQGHAVMIGHDYFARNADADAVVGNAVFLANTTGTVNILGFQQYSDLTGEVANTNAAIAAHAASLGRTVNITTLSDYTTLDANLPGNHVLLVYEMERGGSGSTIGTAWATTLNGFVERGGVVVVCGFLDTSYQILHSSGLMNITAVSSTTGIVNLAAQFDAVAEGVSDPYTAPNGSARYTTTETGIVAETTTRAPVVIHREFGEGADFYGLPYDFYSWDADSSSMLWRAVTIGMDDPVVGAVSQCADTTGATSSSNPGGSAAGEYNATIDALEYAGFDPSNIIPLADPAAAAAAAGTYDVLLFMESELCALSSGAWTSVVTSLVVAGGRVVMTYPGGTNDTFISGLGLFGTGTDSGVTTPYLEQPDPFWNGISHAGYHSATRGWNWSGPRTIPIAVETSGSDLTVVGYYAD